MLIWKFLWVWFGLGYVLLVVFSLGILPLFLLLDGFGNELEILVCAFEEHGLLVYERIMFYLKDVISDCSFSSHFRGLSE